MMRRRPDRALAAPRAGRLLPIMLTVSLVTSISAGVAATHFRSLAQKAASAAPPRRTIITSPVRRDVLRSTITLRADVVDADPVSVPLPTSLGDDLPVITALYVSNGDQVRNGDPLMAVAGRPIFVLVGRIPAYRDLVLGDRGVDVEQLQAALSAIGLSGRGDSRGVFGRNTEHAVRRLYAIHGFDVVTHPVDADAQLAKLRAAVDAAQAARSQPETDDGEPGANVAGADPALANAASALEAAEASMGASVPRGEVAFAPRLPAQIISLGRQLGGLAAAAEPLARVGSGSVELRGRIAPSDLSQVQPGQAATARLAPDGDAAAAVVKDVADQLDEPSSDPTSASTPGYPITLTIDDPDGSSFLGRNVAVTITTATSDEPVWIVPSASIVTTSGGESFITVLQRGARPKRVIVRLGLAADGMEAVEPVRALLHVGARVVIGRSDPRGAPER
jgi:hypothetical protein